MLNAEDFRKEAHRLVDWMAGYMENVEDYPVLSQVKPGAIKSQIPAEYPKAAEPFEQIFQEFEQIIMPGMTHWESPNFFAYFPANKSRESILAEMLTATLGAQCMSWLTSPAATELEESMMEWLRDMKGLPKSWTGVIQSTASEATLAALLSAREKASGFGINRTGFTGTEKFTVYCSEQAHSSIDKAVMIAGMGTQQLRKIPTDENYALKPTLLKAQIEKDKAEGYQPLFLSAALGTTGSTAIDPLEAIGEICEQENIWFHVDAAYSGTALLLPEMRWMAKGVEKADSYVFNPHKWMFTNFDCSAYFVKEPEYLVNTFAITPEYLKTKNDQQVNNFRDWGIPLGRRFRALKLWFVLRSFGQEGLQQKIRHHLTLTQELLQELEAHPDYEMLAPVPVNLLCFRYHPHGVPEEKLNALNEKIMDTLNASGKIFLTHTKLDGKFTLRMVIAHPEVTEQHVQKAWKLIRETAAQVKLSFAAES